MFRIEVILSYLNTHFKNRDIWLIVGLVSLYFITRLVNIESLPIFNDEGIYIHWAKLASQDAELRFISLNDGKQPLQTWGTIPFIKLFPDNYLVAGRLFAVVTGFSALVGVFVLLFYLFNKKAAFIGSLLYIFSPYFLFYDRIAMVDSAVNAGAIWILFFSILLVRTNRLDVALMFGFVAGVSMLAKSSARMFLALSVFAPLTILDQLRKKPLLRVINFGILFGISGVIALFMYNIQRLSSQFGQIEIKNTTFILTFSEWIQNPFQVLFKNMWLIPNFVFSSMGYVVPLLGLIGFYYLLKKDKKLLLYLASWIILPYIAIAFFAEVLFGRYVIFFGSLALIGAAYYFSQINNRKVFIISVGAVALSVSFYLYAIWFNPAQLPFHPSDRGQYITGWPAGWGVKDIIEYARSKTSSSDAKPLKIIAEGDFGMMGDVLNVSLRPSDRISVNPYWPLKKEKLDEAIQKYGEDYQLYVVFAHKKSKDIGPDWNLELIEEFVKPRDKTTDKNKPASILLYEVSTE